MLNVVLTLGLMVGVRAQVPFLGGCPNVEVVQNFNVNLYLGKWYEQQRYFTFFEIAGKCITADYQLVNGMITVRNQQWNTISDTQENIQGTAVQEEGSTEAKLKVTFSSFPIPISPNYWVLGTDYNNYAVVWSCTSFGVLSFRFLWILTRERFPSNEIMAQAYEVLKKQDITTNFLLKTDQKTCMDVYGANNN